MQAPKTIQYTDRDGDTTTMTHVSSDRSPLGGHIHHYLVDAPAKADHPYRTTYTDRALARLVREIGERENAINANP